MKYVTGVFTLDNYVTEVYTDDTDVTDKTSTASRTLNSWHMRKPISFKNGKTSPASENLNLWPMKRPSLSEIIFEVRLPSQ